MQAIGISSSPGIKSHFKTLNAVYGFSSKFFFKLFIMLFYGENSNTKSSFLIKTIKTIWINSCVKYSDSKFIFIWENKK